MFSWCIWAEVEDEITVSGLWVSKAEQAGWSSIYDDATVKLLRSNI